MLASPTLSVSYYPPTNSIPSPSPPSSSSHSRSSGAPMSTTNNNEKMVSSSAIANGTTARASSRSISARASLSALKMTPSPSSQSSLHNNKPDGVPVSAATTRRAGGSLSPPSTCRSAPPSGSSASESFPPFLHPNPNPNGTVRPSLGSSSSLASGSGFASSSSSKNEHYFSPASASGFPTSASSTSLVSFATTDCPSEFFTPKELPSPSGVEGSREDSDEVEEEGRNDEEGDEEEKESRKRRMMMMTIESPSMMEGVVINDEQTHPAEAIEVGSDGGGVAVIMDPSSPPSSGESGSGSAGSGSNSGHGSIAGSLAMSAITHPHSIGSVSAIGGSSSHHHHGGIARWRERYTTTDSSTDGSGASVAGGYQDTDDGYGFADGDGDGRSIGSTAPSSTFTEPKEIPPEEGEGEREYSSSSPAAPVEEVVKRGLAVVHGKGRREYDGGEKAMDVDQDHHYESQSPRGQAMDHSPEPPSGLIPTQQPGTSAPPSNSSVSQVQTSVSHPHTAKGDNPHQSSTDRPLLRQSSTSYINARSATLSLGSDSTPHSPSKSPSPSNPTTGTRNSPSRVKKTATSSVQHSPAAASPFSALRAKEPSSPKTIAGKTPRPLPNDAPSNPSPPLPSQQPYPPPEAGPSSSGSAPSGQAPKRKRAPREHIDLTAYPSPELLKLMSQLLQQIAQTNDSLPRPESTQKSKKKSTEGDEGDRKNNAGSSSSSRSGSPTKTRTPPPQAAGVAGIRQTTLSQPPTPSGPAPPLPPSPRRPGMSHKGEGENDGTPEYKRPPSLLTASLKSLHSPQAHLCFHARNIPGISIESYLLRILKYCPTTNEVFVSLLVYFDRMTRLGGPGNSLSSEVGENDDMGEDEKEKADRVAFAVDSYNVHRLVIAGVTVASKFFSDVFYTNSRYAKVGGLPVHELNQLELQFLLLNDFQLMIPLEEMQRYADQLLIYWPRGERLEDDEDDEEEEEEEGVEGEGDTTLKDKQSKIDTQAAVLPEFASHHHQSSSMSSIGPAPSSAASSRAASRVSWSATDGDTDFDDTDTHSLSSRVSRASRSTASTSSSTIRGSIPSTPGSVASTGTIRGAWDSASESEVEGETGDDEEMKEA